MAKPANSPYISSYSINSSLIESYYTIDISLGIGTFGNSIKIIEKSTKTKKTMKVLPKEFVVNLNSITEIKAFYENLKDLNHPNLNQIKNIYENEDNFFLIREMSDETLKTKMNNNFTPSLFEIKIRVFQLLSAVAYLHEKGYNHGNIKPENVLLFDNNTVRLNDYCHYEKFLRKTNTNSVLFSSPELIENGSMEKSDEWAIGVILYCL